VALPVMATTLSLIVIFLPVAFMTGYARRFIYPFGWTMAFAILVSMIVSFTLTPMLSSRWLKASHLGQAEEDTKHHRLFRALDRWYSASLRWTLAHPMWIIGISAALVLLTIPLNRMVVPHVRACGGHERVHRARRHAAGNVDRRQLRRSRGIFVKEIGEIEGVSKVAYLAGAPDRYTHFHLFFYLLPSNERKITQTDIHDAGAPCGCAPSGLRGEHRGPQPARGRRQLPDPGGAARARPREAVRVLAADSREGQDDGKASST
jgi:HAE1 family hydrophobic/amphiphilic exporter-1